MSVLEPWPLGVSWKTCRKCGVSWEPGAERAAEEGGYPTRLKDRCACGGCWNCGTGLLVQWGEFTLVCTDCDSLFRDVQTRKPTEVQS